MVLKKEILYLVSTKREKTISCHSEIYDILISSHFSTVHFNMQVILIVFHIAHKNQHVMFLRFHTIHREGLTFLRYVMIL